MYRSLILLCGTLAWLAFEPATVDAQVGDDLVLFDLHEAGTVYDPSDGTVVRYLTGTESALFFEARNAFGLPLGEIRRAPDLSAAPPLVTAAADVIDFFEADGVTPIAGSLFHPVVCSIAPDTLGMYAIDALPDGVHMFFRSTDGGQSWVLAGMPILPLSGGGSGILAAVRVPNILHVDGFEIRVYYQTGGGAIRFLRSSILAVGLEKYTFLDTSTDAAVLDASEAGPSGFSPTGAVVPLSTGAFGMFFVPQTDDYIGFAESDGGLLNWTVTRGADNPIVSTSANAAAPDPARPEIKEIAVLEGSFGWDLYFDGAAPGGPLLNRAVGRFSIVESSTVEFVRGDSNGDGALGIADAIFALSFLFSGGPSLCHDALDTDDSGALDLADPINLLGYLFSMGPAPTLPFPDCGTDPTADTLDCLARGCSAP